MQTFGAHLKAWRLKRGHTQRTLGESVGMTEPTAAKWERGEILPTPEAIEDLVRVLKPDDPDHFRFLAYLQHVPMQGRKHFKEA